MALNENIGTKRVTQWDVVAVGELTESGHNEIVASFRYKYDAVLWAKHHFKTSDFEIVR